MTAFLILVSVLVPLALGFLFLCLLWPDSASVFADFLFKCCLSVGFGFGISSGMVFVWLLLAGHLTPGFFVCQWLALAGLSALALYRRKQHVSTAPVEPRHPSSGGNAPRLIRFAFAAALLCAAAYFLFLLRLAPNGKYDAIAHWNLEARFLYPGGDGLRQFSYMTWEHADYPLLIPASIAASWAFIGTQTTIVPSVIALLFTFSLIGLVPISIARLRGERQGLLAGLCLLGTPFLIKHGSSQYADVPLAFFFVATFALLFRRNESPSHRGFLLLSGAAAGLAAWTKNEGILFVTLLVPLHFFFTMAWKGKMNGVRETFGLLIGLAPILVIVVVHKIYMGQPNDLVAGQNLPDTTHRLLDFSRYALVTKEMALGIFSFGTWNRFLPLPALLLVYGFLAGIGLTDKKNVPAMVMGALLILFMLAAYFSIYILTPKDLVWHLETSLNRLLLQLWPLFILIYFAFVRPPPQAGAVKNASV